jgi:hypothetical protein
MGNMNIHSDKEMGSYASSLGRHLPASITVLGCEGAEGAESMLCA